MRHRLAGRHLGRDTAHRTALYRNLITDLLRYERITTTEAKAKEIRPMAERIITLARRGDVHARRQALRVVYDPKVVKYAFDEIGPRMASRPGGYLRITGLEPRKGDGARMAVIELVDYGNAPAAPRPERVTAAPAASARAAAAPASVAPAAEADEVEDVTEETVAEVEEETVAEIEETAEDEVDVTAEDVVEEAVAEADGDAEAEAKG